jgi:hypothetical protein
MYGAILITDYWLLATIVRESLGKGYTTGLDWLVIGSSHSLTNALEGIGYGFMGMAALFVGFAFPTKAGRLEKAARWVLIINGVAGIAGTVLGGMGLLVATLPSLAIWCITFPVATILLAVVFKRASFSQPQ